MLASLARRIVVVGLRAGTKKFFRSYFPGARSFASFANQFLDSPRRRLGGKKTRRAPRTVVVPHIHSEDMYTCAHAAQYLKAHLWTRMRLRARTSSLFIRRDIKAYARHQTAPVVVNFVTTWLPVAAARLFMWSEGSFARRKKALNAATQFGKLITLRWKQPHRHNCTTGMYFIWRERFNDDDEAITYVQKNARTSSILSFPGFLIVRNRCNVHNRNYLALFPLAI